MEITMIWFAETIGTSIGKKLLMAVTGLCFCVFLVIHLAGNLTLYGGSELFNTYAGKLHQLGMLIYVAEWGLFLFALIHVASGLILFIENRKARPVRYHYQKSAGGRSLGSATMPYTGAILLGFLIYHLLNFRFTGETDTDTYQMVAANFRQPLEAVFYIIAMVVAAVHISHGFWSAFQTLGIDHVKYSPIIKGLRTVFYVTIAIGFGSIPIYFLFFSST